jgi:hypothetical protein
MMKLTTATTLTLFTSYEITHAMYGDECNLGNVRHDLLVPNVLMYNFPKLVSMVKRPIWLNLNGKLQCKEMSF